jgi:hypothetical protein
MRSDISFQRLIKLWISLWSLVSEGKRHLETVTMLLQRIVFEKQGYPRFKNWPEICKLGEVDPMLMAAVATVKLSNPDDRIEQLIAAFPECFTDKEIAGPVPLSAIRRSAQLKGRKEHGAENGRDFPVSFEAVPAYIPLQQFDWNDDRSGIPLPESIPKNAPQGSIVTWEGKQFVVLECNIECRWLHVAPAELIRVDL